MAPELLRFGKMSTAADVYSFGIMMWELLTGAVAFTGQHFGSVIERVGDFWVYVPGVIMLLFVLLYAAPDRRASDVINASSTAAQLTYIIVAPVEAPWDEVS
jgi:serine/threonine protein kinase